MSNRIEEYLESRSNSTSKKEEIVNPGAAEILAQSVNSSYKNIPK
jgi:uridine kinase